MGQLQQQLEHRQMRAQLEELCQRFGLPGHEDLGKRLFAAERRIEALEQNLADLLDPDQLVTEVRSGMETIRTGRPGRPRKVA